VLFIAAMAASGRRMAIPGASDLLECRTRGLYSTGVRKATIAEQVREIYEDRPYPTPDRASVVKSGQQLPPFEWIRAMGALQQSSPKRILVAGCGTGAEAFALQKRFPDARVVGVDFSSRSIRQAKSMQKQLLTKSPIRFRQGDLTDRKFMDSLGCNFDFVSCHGVLSYIPEPGRAVRNLSRCLSRDGALYLGVNSASHFSVKGRPALRALGLDLRRPPAEQQLRRVLRLCDALGTEQDVPKAKLPLNYLAGDLFGPLIHNLSLRRWISLGRDAGLSFTGHYYAFQKLRRAINKGLLDILQPWHRAEVYLLIDWLDPSGFHQMTFTKRAIVSLTWSKEDMLRLRPVLTSLYRIVVRKRRDLLRLESEPINTIVEIDSANWERQFLRSSTGKRTMAEILQQLPEGVGWEALQKRLYLFYQLAVINFEKV
jgi:SAM-dependent methyltransferase